MHKISEEFEFWPDRTTDYGVSCPWGQKKKKKKKKSHRLIMGKWCLSASSYIFDRIIIKVVGNQDRHKSSDEFDFGPLVSMTHLYVFWNEIWPWHIGLRCAIVALYPTGRKRVCEIRFSAPVKIEKTLVWYARNNFLCNRTSLLNVWSLLCYSRIRSYATVTLIAYELHVQQYSLAYGVFECLTSIKWNTGIVIECKRTRSFSNSMENIIKMLKELLKRLRHRKSP